MKEKKYSEIEIIKNCQSGNFESFSEIYQFYFDTIYRFVFYKTLNKENAEDITSDIFMKILKKINTFDATKSSFKTWIFTIARNTIIDFYRAQKLTSNIEDVWDLDVFESDESSLTETLDKKISHEKLHKILKKLPTKTREILILRFWQGQSWQEIAEITGKSEASLKMKTGRTLKELGKNFSLFLLLPYILKF